MKAGRGDAHQYAKEKIQEARQRLAALDRELADLRRQSRKVARSADTRIALLAMREELARLADERLKAYAELVELIGLSEMSSEHMGLA